jgi:DNA-binding beta-propeller fold protein YncE
MAMDTVHKFLFVANQGAGTVSAFSVNTATGMLAPVPGSPFAAGSAPLGIAVDPMGNFVFVANQNSSTISCFSINSMSGALTPVPGSPFAGVSNPFGVTVSPTGAFLFVSSFNAGSGTGNTVSTFTINSSTGALTLAGSGVATASPAGITAPIGLATDGKFLFVGDHMAESVVSFSIAGSGALTPVSTLPTPASGCGVSCHHNPLRLAIDPMDKFVFWTNVQAGTLVSFSNNNGTLAPITEVSTGQHPFGLAVDPTGSFIFVVNKVDNTISGFSVNSATGMVSPLMGSPFAEGSSAPTDIVIVARQ